MSSTNAGASSTSARRSRWDSAALRADLHRGRIDGALALIVTGLIFWLLWSRIDSGASDTVAVMPSMADASLYWMYWLSQAFGWSALVWAWFTIMLGLLRSSRSPAWMPSAKALERWHRTTSLTTIWLMFAHALWFFAEQIRYDVDEGSGFWASAWSAFWRTFVPGGYDSGTGVIAVLIGLLALYLAIPLGLAYYARRWMGQRVWRVLHASIIVVYVLSVWHTLLYGTNVWFDGWWRTAVWLLQLPIAGLLVFRLLAPRRRTSPGVWPAAGRVLARVLGVVTILILVVVLATGADGGRDREKEVTPSVMPQAVIWGGLAVFVVGVLVAVLIAHRQAARLRHGKPMPVEAAGS